MLCPGFFTHSFPEKTHSIHHACDLGKENSLCSLQGLLISCQASEQDEFLFITTRHRDNSSTGEHKQSFIQKNDKGLFSFWHLLQFLQEPGSRANIIINKFPTIKQYFMNVKQCQSQIKTSFFVFTYLKLSLESQICQCSGYKMEIVRTQQEDITQFGKSMLLSVI